MKINSISSADAVSKYHNSVSPVAKSKPSVGVSDSVELSDGAQKYSALLKTAKDEMAKTDQQEQARAESIKAQIGANAYHVSGGSVVKDILGGWPTGQEE